MDKFFKVKDCYIDGKFVKVSGSPILDYLDYTVSNIDPCLDHSYFYSLISKSLRNHSGIEDLTSIQKLTTLESKIYPVKSYRKLSDLGIIYKNQTKSHTYTYTHRGQHLSKLGNLFFPLFCFFFVSSKNNLTYQNMLRFRRLDFAFDFYGIDLVDLISSKNCLIFSKKRLKPCFYTPRYVSKQGKNYVSDTEYCKPNINSTQTFYLGSVSSPFSLCIYKRHLKLNVTGPITRVELRLKKKYANVFFLNLLNRWRYLAGTNPSFVKFESLYNHTICDELYKLLSSYLSIKQVGSSKSIRLDRHKTCPWFEHLLSSIKL